MTSRLNSSASRRLPPQLSDPADVDVLPNSPPSRAGRRTSAAVAMEQMAQDRGMPSSASFEMQPAGQQEGGALDVKDVARLKTMGVVQKLNKASARSKVEGQVLTVQKLCIFFAVSGLALAIIEQEALW